MVLSEKIRDKGFDAGQPLYVQIKARIRQVIRERRLRPGHRLPPVRELGDLIGASRATAARAITRMIREGYFVSRPREGIYVNEAGSAKNGTVLRTVYGLVAASTVQQRPEDYLAFNPFWSQIFAGIRRGMPETEDPIRLRFSFIKDFLQEKEVTPRGRSWDDVGFLILGDPRPGQMPQLNQLGSPIVQIHGVNSSKKISSVRVDSAAGSEMLVDHLVSLGHQQIGFCGALNPTSFIDYEKFKGFRRAMKRHGLAGDDDRYCQSCGPTLQDGYRSVQPLLKLADRPTAVLFLNDEAALGAMRAINDAGLSVPRDLAVAGFDNLPTGGYVIPSLTTVSTRMMDLGRRGIRQLFDLVETGEQADEVLTPELVVRESTGKKL